MIRTADGIFTSKDGEHYLSLVELTSGVEIPVNGEAPTQFSNDYFEGSILFMHTPVYSDKELGEKDYQYAEIFRGKKRKWEIHIQGRYKEAFFGKGDTAPNPKAQPQGGPGTVYLGIEVEKPQKWGLVTSAVTRVLASILKSLNSSSPFRLSLGYGIPSDPNKHTEERPHIIYPLPYIPNKILSTLPGEKVPQLGCCAAFENWENMEKADLVLKPDNIYTFIFYSMYADMLEWTVVELPGFRPISLSKFWGDEPSHFVMYDAVKCGVESSNPHYLCDRRSFVDIRIQQKKVKDLHRKGAMSPTRPLSPSGEYQSYASTASPDTAATVYSRNSYETQERENKSESTREAMKSIAESRDTFKPLDSEEAGPQEDEIAKENELSDDTDGELSDATSEDLVEQEFQSAHSEESDKMSDVSDQDQWRGESVETLPVSPTARASEDVKMLGAECSTWSYGIGEIAAKTRLFPTDRLSAPWYIVTLGKVGKSRVLLTIWFLLEVADAEGSAWSARSLHDVLELVMAAGDGSLAPYLKRNRLRRSLPSMISPPTSKKRQVVGSVPARPLEFVRQKLIDTFHNVNDTRCHSVVLQLRREMLANFMGMKDGDDTDAQSSPDIPQPPAFFELGPLTYTAFQKGMKEQTHIKGVVGSVIFEGRIAEEYLTLRPDEGTIKLWSPFAQKPRINISISSILNVRARQGKICECFGGRFFCWEAQTKLKTFVFLSPDKATRDQFISNISRCIPKQLSSSNEILSSRFTLGGRSLLVHPLIMDPSYCRRWNPSNRIVLNDRRVLVGSNKRITDCVAFSASLLNAALEFGGSSPQTAAEKNGQNGFVINNVDEFFDAVGLLKTVNFESMAATQKLCFWLNIYHTLMLHGFLQVGRPSSGKQLSIFQNRISYLVESHPFSLAEIEFLILRSNLSTPLHRIKGRVWGTGQPTYFWRRTNEVLPASQAGILHLECASSDDQDTGLGFGAKRQISKYTNQASTGTRGSDLHLEGLEGSDDEVKSNRSKISSRVDASSEFWARYAPGYPEIRISFVLNYGTLSCLDSIMVFYDNQLEAQLEYASSQFIQTFCHVEGGSRFGIIRALSAISARVSNFRGQKSRPSLPSRVTFPHCCRRFKKDIEYSTSNSWPELVSRFLTPDKKELLMNSIPRNQTFGINKGDGIKYHKFRCGVHPNFRKMHMFSPPSRHSTGGQK